MSRRKDQERFARLKAQNSAYHGFRGSDARTEKPVDVLETVVCSVCNRRRNVPATGLPNDRANFICRGCQDEQTAASSA